MDTVAAILVGVVIGALAVVIAGRLKGGGSPDMEPRCAGLVRLTRSGATINARPENVCLHVGRRLAWEVNSGSGDKVEIDFDPAGGPFDHNPHNPHNPRKGHYETTQPVDIDSNLAGVKGRFKYTVKWTPAGGQPITLDPVICIKA